MSGMRAVGAGVVALVLAAGSAGAQDAAPETTPPQGKKVNTLRGVAVSKADGSPVADATVLLAHAERAHLYFDPEDLQGWGDDDRVLLFFRKRNGRTVCGATTDGQGRFTLTRFTTPGAKYNLAAVHPERGIALLTGLVPQDYTDRELRIELEPGGYILTDALERSPDQSRWTCVDVELVAERPAASADAAECAVPGVQLHFRGSRPFHLSAEAPAGRTRLGPLPGGRQFRVTHRLYLRGLPYLPTLSESTVTVVSGQTVECLRPAGGATVTGRVTGLDGLPLPNVNVLARIGADAATATGAVTDGDGAFRLTGLPPGTHKLELLRYAARTGPG